MPENVGQTPEIERNWGIDPAALGASVALPVTAETIYTLRSERTALRAERDLPRLDADAVMPWAKEMYDEAVAEDERRMRDGGR